MTSSELVSGLFDILTAPIPSPAGLVTLLGIFVATFAVFSGRYNSISVRAQRAVILRESSITRSYVVRMKMAVERMCALIVRASTPEELERTDPDLIWRTFASRTFPLVMYMSVIAYIIAWGAGGPKLDDEHSQFERMMAIAGPSDSRTLQAVFLIAFSFTLFQTMRRIAEREERMITSLRNTFDRLFHYIKPLRVMFSRWSVRAPVSIFCALAAMANFGATPSFFSLAVLAVIALVVIYASPSLLMVVLCVVLSASFQATGLLIASAAAAGSLSHVDQRGPRRMEEYALVVAMLAMAIAGINPDYAYVLAVWYLAIPVVGTVAIYVTWHILRARFRHITAGTTFRQATLDTVYECLTASVSLLVLVTLLPIALELINYLVIYINPAATPFPWQLYVAQGWADPWGAGFAVTGVILISIAPLLTHLVVLASSVFRVEPPGTQHLLQRLSYNAQKPKATTAFVESVWFFFIAYGIPWLIAYVVASIILGLLHALGIVSVVLGGVVLPFMELALQVGNSFAMLLPS